MVDVVIVAVEGNWEAAKSKSGRRKVAMGCNKGLANKSHLAGFSESGSSRPQPGENPAPEAYRGGNPPVYRRPRCRILTIGSIAQFGCMRKKSTVRRRGRRKRTGV
jgi:hypothetical protein